MCQRLEILMVVLGALLLMASCSDDASSGTNNGVTSDTGADLGAGADGGDAGGHGLDAGAPDAAHDDMKDAGGDGASSMDATADAGGRDLGEVDVEWPSDRDAYAETTTHTTFVSALGVPVVEANGTVGCCRDFGTISMSAGPDNAVARLIDNQGALVPSEDLSDVLQSYVESGVFVSLLDHRGLDGDDDADGFVLAVLEGDYASGTDYAQAAAANGEFTIAPESFDDGAASPRHLFNPSEMTGGSMIAHGPSTIPFAVPMGGITGSFVLELTLEGAQLTGEAMVSEDGVTYASGEITGWVTVDAFMERVNEELESDRCDCLGASDVFTEGANGWQATECVADADTKCPGDSERLCATFGGDTSCQLLVGSLVNVADLDTDGDSEPDALSAGYTFEGVEATVIGVSP